MRRIHRRNGQLDSSSLIFLLRSPLPGIVYLTLLCLLFLMGRRRAATGQVAEDRGFMIRAVLVFVIANILAVACLRRVPAASFGNTLTSWLGIGVMIVGLLLRAWSIRHLGEFFTVDVAVAPHHRLIESGPYKRLRHPSYTGLLIVVAGMGLCFGNLLSILALLVPFAALAIWRMRVEEEALASGLGSPYREYMQRTKRLIPGIY